MQSMITPTCLWAGTIFDELFRYSGSLPKTHNCRMKTPRGKTIKVS
jgi:hypothetical protein